MRLELFMYQVVLDTNVLVAALRSKIGASHRLLALLGDSRWRPNVTVPVVLELAKLCSTTSALEVVRGIVKEHAFLAKIGLVSHVARDGCVIAKHRVLDIRFAALDSLKKCREMRP